MLLLIGCLPAWLGADEALKSPAERRRKQRKLAKEKAKAKMGLLDSFRFLSKSKYLGFVGLIVLSYGLSMEFTEIVWKVSFFFSLFFSFNSWMAKVQLLLFIYFS